MHASKKLLALVALALLLVAATKPVHSADKDDGWIVLFNGKDLTGWKLRSE